MEKCNVQVRVAGNPKGVDEPFSVPVSIGNGETRIQFVNRLASMKNLHAIDDTNGTLVYGRPAEL
jgi:prophage tail gpP-like protein